MRFFGLTKIFGLTRNFYMTCFSQMPSDYGLQRFIIKIRINEVIFLLMNRDQNISSDKRGIWITRLTITMYINMYNYNVVISIM